MVRSCIFALLAALLFTPPTTVGAHAAISCTPIKLGDSFEVCYTFNGKKGEFPEAGLTADPATGDLYSTTFGSLGDGAPGKRCSKSCGSATRILQDDSELKVLHHFAPGDPAGSFPASELVVQDGGTIYGTAEYGPGTGCGGLGCGTVFKIQVGRPSTITSVAGFCTRLDCADGAFPRPGLLASGTGADANLFGMTMLGGTGEGSLCGSVAGGCGTVYEISDPMGTRKKTILHNFCTRVSGNFCMDGAVPLGRLWQGEAGLLYGTTQFGGAHGKGVVFQLTPDGTETVLYSFCSAANCSDGAVPEAGVTADSAGNLYGTTAAGGAICDKGADGCGVVFKLTHGTWTESVLHIFRGAAKNDGELPQGPVALDHEGNLYGTTLRGGNNSNKCGIQGVNVGCGIVFTISAIGTYRVLHSFGPPDNDPDGEHPEGALLLQNDDRYLYGSTRVGGDMTCTATGCGTLYRIDLTIAKAKHRGPGLGMVGFGAHRRS